MLFPMPNQQSQGTKGKATFNTTNITAYITSLVFDNYSNEQTIVTSAAATTGQMLFLLLNKQCR